MLVFDSHNLVDLDDIFERKKINVFHHKFKKNVLTPVCIIMSNLHTCIKIGDELFTDAFKYTIKDDFFYEVEGKVSIPKKIKGKQTFSHSNWT